MYDALQDNACYSRIDDDVMSLEVAARASLYRCLAPCCNSLFCAHMASEQPHHHLEDIEIRSLRESELDEWFKHVASVFASTGEAYFRRHWFSDPHRV